MEREPSIKKNYIFNLFYQLLAIIVPVITTPYVSRILQADGIGAYSYALSIVTYCSMIAALGVATYGQLEIAKLRENIHDRSIVFWEIVIARIVLSIVLVAVYFGIGRFLTTNLTLYRIMVINLVADALDISWLFQGLEQFKVTVIRNTFIRLISTICIFVFIRTKNDLMLYAIILQGSTLIGNVLLWPYIRRFVQICPIKELKFYKHWKNSIIYFIPTVATSVYTVLDKSMIGLITKSSFENGYYEQAHKIEQILLVALTSLGTVTLPRLTYLWDKGDSKSVELMLKKTTEFVSFMAFPMMFGISAVTEKLIPLFLGNGYEPCIGMLRIFSILLVVVGLDNTIGKQCLVATGRQSLFNRGVIAGACVNFIANLILIPRFMGNGAAVGSVLAELTILCIFLYYGRDVISVYAIAREMIHYGTLGLIMGICTWGVGKILPLSVWGLLIQVLFGGLVYLLLLIFSKDAFLEYLFNRIRSRIKRC